MSTFLFSFLSWYISKDICDSTVGVGVVEVHNVEACRLSPMVLRQPGRVVAGKEYVSYSCRDQQENEADMSSYSVG